MSIVSKINYSGKKRSKWEKETSNFTILSTLKKKWKTYNFFFITNIIQIYRVEEENEEWKMDRSNENFNYADNNAAA